MLALAVRTSAILVLAWIATRLLHRATAATRHLVWHAALVVVLAAPVVAPLAPRITVREVPGITNLAAPLLIFFDELPPSGGIANRSDTQPPNSISRLDSQTVEPSGTSVNLIAPTSLWLAGSMALALWFAIGWIATILAARHAVTAPSAWQIQLDALCSRAGIACNIRLRMLDGETSPLTAGLMRSTILLPDAAKRWSDERRHLVLQHELAHVRRRDCRVQALAQLACVVYWFNPLIWIAARHLRVERERACDDEVLLGGAQPSTYAAHLLEIARGLRSSARLTAALSMARPSELEERLLALLAPDRARTPARTARPIVALMFALATAVAFGATTADDSAIGRDASSRDSGARQRSVLGLAASNQADAVDPLLAALDDANQDLREKAAIGLGLMSSPEAIPALVKALGDRDAQVREKAAIGLAFRRDRRSADALLAAMNDPDSQVREKAAIALGTSGDERAVAALERALRDPDRQVREKAAAGLTLARGQGLDPAAGDRLRDGLRSLVGGLMALVN